MNSASSCNQNDLQTYLYNAKSQRYALWMLGVGLFISLIVTSAVVLSNIQTPNQTLLSLFLIFGFLQSIFAIVNYYDEHHSFNVFTLLISLVSCVWAFIACSAQTSQRSTCDLCDIPLFTAQVAFSWISFGFSVLVALTAAYHNLDMDKKVQLHRQDARFPYGALPADEKNQQTNPVYAINL